jgi:hypothetical protein
MQTVTPQLATAKITHVEPVSLKKVANKELTQPIEITVAKDGSLARLLASCCDCV